MYNAQYAVDGRWLRFPRATLSLSVLLLILSATGRSHAGPAFWVPTPGRDLGDVRQNETVHFQVRLQNLVDRAVKVVEKSRSCGHLSLALPAVLQPKETRDVEATFQTLLREGPVVARITLIEAGTVGDTGVDVWASCKVVPEFAVSDPEIRFPILSSTTPVRKTLRIAPVAAQELRIRSVTVDRPIVALDVPPPEGRGPWTIGVEPKEPRCQGDYRGTITVRTTSDRVPELRIPVSYSVDAGYLLEPPCAVLGIREYEVSQQTTVAVRIRRRDARAFSFTRIQTTEPFITATCDSLGRSADEHTVTIGLTLVGARPPANTLLDEGVMLFGEPRDLPIVRIGVQGMLASAVACCTSGTPQALGREQAALASGTPPYFRTEDLDGRVIGIDTFVGKPTILLFLSGSAACEMLSSRLAHCETKPFAVFGLLHWSPDDSRDFAARTGFRGPWLRDIGGQIGQRFHIGQCPYVVVLDDCARIVLTEPAPMDVATLLQHARAALTTNDAP